MTQNLHLMASRYARKVQRNMKIWRSPLVSPIDKASYWMETLAEYGPLEHLKLNDGLNFVQYFSIDIVLAMGLIIICLAYLVSWIILKNVYDIGSFQQKRKSL